MPNLKDFILNKIAGLPRCKICNLPTPIQKISNYFGNNNNIFIKRDDLTIPIFGGNKARKEEYIFGNLIEKNNKGILWSSSSISNELRIISYFGYKLKKEVVLLTWKNRKENIQYSPNLVASQRYGAKILYYPAQNREPYIFNKIAEKYLQRSYYIQSTYDEALGATSYIECGKEIDEFMENNRINFDYIFVCSSGATQVGLEIAKIVFGWNTEVIGINHIPWKSRYWLNEHFNEIWNKTIGILDTNLEKPNFYNEVKYALPGYGQVNSEILKLCTEFEIKEGILLDPYYSGKAFYGMLDFLKNYADKNVLFTHTGGGINLFQNNVAFNNISYGLYIKYYFHKQLKQIIKFIYKQGGKIKRVFK